MGMDVYSLLYLTWVTRRSYCIAQGALLNVMWELPRVPLRGEALALGTGGDRM